MQQVPARVGKTCLWRLAGDMALARGDLTTATESVAWIRSVLKGTRYQDQYHLPLVRLDFADVFAGLPAAREDGAALRASIRAMRASGRVLTGVIDGIGCEGR